MPEQKKQSSQGGARMQLTEVLANLSYRDIEHIWHQLKTRVLASNKVFSNLNLGTIMVQKQSDGTYRVSLNNKAAIGITKEEYNDLDRFQVKGMLNYMSPEVLMWQCKGRQEGEKLSWDVCAANQLWQLGLVLFVMLYKTFPIVVYQKKFVRETGSFDHLSYMIATSTPATQAKTRQDPMYCGRDKPIHQMLVHFYNFMRHTPAEYNKLFSPLQGGHQLLYNDVKALLSLNPIARKAWLQQNKSKQQGSSSIGMLLRAASEAQKQQERKPKRTRLSATQTQKKSNSI